jgi:uncharacterized protein DUF3854
MSLHPQHLSDLQKSGLSDATIELMQVYSMSPADMIRFLGQDSSQIESALAFPYFDADGKRNGFLRIKIFPEIKDRDGHTIKYMQQKNSPVHLYMLPAVIPALQDPKVPLYIVEGEKKTAKAIELGLAAIGVGGVWNWLRKGSHDPIEDFNSINLWRREVIIVPDSDTWNKEKKSTNIRRAVFYLCRELRQRGSTIKFMRLEES